MHRSLKELLQLLLKSNIFCNLCYKIIDTNESSFFIEDLIVLSEKTSMMLGEVMSAVLGAKYVRLCSSGILCCGCTENLVNTYRFIDMCKCNTNKLCDAIDILEHSLKNTTGDTNNMYINVDVCNSEVLCNTTENKNSRASTNINKGPVLKSEIFTNESSANSDIFDSPCPVEVNKEVKRKATKKNLQSNLTTRKKNNTSYTTCKYCKTTYSNFYRMKQHMLRVHAPKKFKCSECNRSYGSQAILKQHKYNSHSSLVCPDCGKSYTSRSTFNVHLESHSLKLICQTCGRVFKNKRNFSNHIKLNICKNIRKISLDKKFVCDYCNKKYSSKHTLQVHINYLHGFGKSHACSWCNKKFHAISKLRLHEVKHTQEKKFCCDICGGRFVTKESLCYHTRIHTGERPYQCEFCEQRFLSSSRRTEHVRRHHQEPTIECDLCHTKFRRQSCLTRHKKRHFNINSRLHYARLATEEKK